MNRLHGDEQTHYHNKLGTMTITMMTSYCDTYHDTLPWQTFTTTNYCANVGIQDIFDPVMNKHHFLEELL